MQQEILREAAALFGTPSYVYWMDGILERIAEVRRAFGNRLGISYAVKANPNRALLRRLKEHVEHLDVSSGGELIVASEAGWDPCSFTFVGPGKTDRELRLAAEGECGVIVAESEEELERLDQIGAERGKALPVVLRVNPKMVPKGYGVSMAMRPTPFGIDEEALDTVLERCGSLAHLQFQGFHVYAGTQCLNNESIAENFANCARIFREASHRHHLRPRRLIFGSGFGIPYHEREEPIALAAIAELSNPVFDQLREDPATREAALSLELGRYLVGEAGVYLTTVIRKKQSRGKEFLILDGGMNHHLAASGNLGSVIKRNYPIRCLNTGRLASGKGKQELVGNLCTSIDSLGRDVDLGPVEAGDILAVGCSGAYGLTASPLHFITHEPPKEILVETRDGRPVMRDITLDGPVARPPAWAPQG